MLGLQIFNHHHQPPRQEWSLQLLSKWLFFCTFALTVTDPNRVMGVPPQIPTLITEIETPSSELEEQSPTPFVSQLSDVNPTDWAFQALQSLTLRYDCVTGFPDQTFQGNRPLTRNQFAAGLRDCIDPIRTQLENISDSSIPEDLETLQKLMTDFRQELEQLQNRTQELDLRVIPLENQQFSPTTKLVGAFIFSLATPFQQDQKFDEQTVFSYRTRLNFNTSFSGKDLLKVQLETGNVRAFSQGAIPLSYSSNTNEKPKLQKLYYKFPVGDRSTLAIGVGGYNIADIVTAVSPIAIGLGNTGSVNQTLMGTEYLLIPIVVGTGVGANLYLAKHLKLDLGYITTHGGSPLSGESLFESSYLSLAQLTWTGDPLQFALIFEHGYVGKESPAFRGFYRSVQTPATANLIAAEINYRLTPSFELGGGAYYALVRGIGTRPDYSLWSWHLTAFFNNFGNQGSQLALVTGSPPYTRDLGNLAETTDTGLMTELYYLYRLNDHIFLTPSLIWLQHPFNQTSLESTLLGVLRTTFLF